MDPFGTFPLILEYVNSIAILMFAIYLTGSPSPAKQRPCLPTSPTHIQAMRHATHQKHGGPNNGGQSQTVSQQQQQQQQQQNLLGYSGQLSVGSPQHQQQQLQQHHLQQQQQQQQQLQQHPQQQQQQLLLPSLQMAGGSMEFTPNMEMPMFCSPNGKTIEINGPPTGLCY